jgi:hypothetical protein
MKLLGLYARVVHALRSLLQQRGLLQPLDGKAATSRRALWVRSLLSVMDFEDFTKLDLPWWTFAASQDVSEFLAQRPEARVLEWGSGSSTSGWQNAAPPSHRLNLTPDGRRWSQPPCQSTSPSSRPRFPRQQRPPAPGPSDGAIGRSTSPRM